MLLFQEAEIKKMAKQGNRDGCVLLAKQLVNLRKQRTRSHGMSAKVSAVGSQAKVRFTIPLWFSANILAEADKSSLVLVILVTCFSVM